jgi:threonine dehydratase
LVDRTVLVGDDDIRAGQEALWRVMRIAAEPGAATPIAALLSGAYVPAAGERVGALVSGGNTASFDFAAVAPDQP